MNVSAAVFFPFLLLMFSCNSDGNGTHGSPADTATLKSRPVAYDSSLIKGQEVDSVVCSERPAVSYSLYLPSYYTPAKKFPCIFFFDAHARGPLPISMYKALAEKYGFIFIASNVSKNGMQWPEINDGVAAMMSDARSRMNIDTQRIYTSGFSGGSKVAASVAIFDGGIAGVIGCAAGFPQVDRIQEKFDYFGIAGDGDFNLIGMEQLDAALEHIGFNHQLLESEGMHDWPAVADFGTALLWMQVYAMKQGTLQKNDTVINALRSDYDKRIATAHAAGDLMKEGELRSGQVRVLEGIADLAAEKKDLAALVNSASYKKTGAAEEKLEQQESAMQDDLAQQFPVQDKKWWIKKIADLHNAAHTAKTEQEAHSYDRVLSFLGLVGYMTVMHDLNTGDGARIADHLLIFRMIDPKNPDCPYLDAVYNIKQGNDKQSIADLGQAAALGYNDLAQITAEPAFATLKDNADFQKIVAKVRANMHK